MTRINLYPWRVAREQHKKKQFLTVLVSCCILTIIFCYGENWYLTKQISKQEDNNQYLNNEILITNKKLREIAKVKSQKKAILDRLSVLQELDGKRQSAIYLINQIVDLINPLVVINKIERDDSLVKIMGYSESNSGVAKFLRDIELSPYFDSAELNKIKVMTTKDRHEGNLSFQHYFELKFYQKLDHDSANNETEIKTSDKEGGKG